MRLIDADELTKDLTYDICGLPLHGNHKTDYANIRATIMAQPTVDAVPVVRCFNCKASSPTKTTNTVYCMAWERIVSKNGFCSYGEKIEEK